MIIFICIVQYVKEKLCRERKECRTQKSSLAENNGKEISIQIIFILDDQRKEMSSLPIKFFTLPPEACNPTSWIHYKFTPSNFNLAVTTAHQSWDTSFASYSHSQLSQLFHAPDSVWLGSVFLTTPP